METLFAVLHVVSAVFIVGPMAILPMTAMRAVRAGNAGQVEVLAKSTNLISLLSLLVVFFGFGVMGLADKKYGLSIVTPWILWSIILYVVALGLTLFLVVPTMRRAAEALTAAGAAEGGSATATPSKYPAIAAGSGVASLLLVAVVVLMVWKP
ncbi:DUF2269 family protein [Leifsonia shinshuensis]|uniref:Putative membrane protein n=1 Tax=Leifsonia shinshuensis TaxID=150026 RepID=A0A853CWX1_9MICO|nr:DUF2269 family protein [Leifsonia shinshuensis]NYJ25137.1 putative membrane protein [Leifsonia shinshuensis]